MASIAITNAKVFDGEKSIGVKTVVIEDGLISNKTKGDTEIDGGGCTLLPGLFDCHVHLDKLHFLELAARHGVTTVLDCGTRSVDTVNYLKSRPNVARVLTCYPGAFGPNSKLRVMMNFPETCRVKDVADASRYVKERIADGADYIKIIMEINDQNNGVEFPVDILAALVEEAHKNGKKVYAHTAAVGTYAIAAKLGADILTHVPFAPPIPLDVIKMMADKKLVCIPTLVMMEGIINVLKKAHPELPIKLEGSLQSLSAMREAGVKVLAGTDSNLDDPTTLFDPCFGTSLHREMLLMTQSGFTPVEALKSATGDPADYFGLTDRGRIEPGRKADLILVQGDPTARMEDIRNVRKAWIGGVSV
jgi:imidazolonepropionase-like amidohydrolase